MLTKSNILWILHDWSCCLAIRREYIKKIQYEGKKRSVNSIIKNTQMSRWGVFRLYFFSSSCHINLNLHICDYFLFCSLAPHSLYVGRKPVEFLSEDFIPKECEPTESSSALNEPRCHCWLITRCYLAILCTKFTQIQFLYSIWCVLNDTRLKCWQ